MKEVIMKVPSFSADYPKAPIYVADLVRCKECKHYNGSYCFNIEALMPKAPNPNDFCSYGERNEQTKRSEK